VLDVQSQAEDDPDPEVEDAQLLDAVREALADAAAGRVYSHEEVVEALRQRARRDGGPLTP
jgi:predicted transcriptional regulator